MCTGITYASTEIKIKQKDCLIIDRELVIIKYLISIFN